MAVMPAHAGASGGGGKLPVSRDAGRRWPDAWEASQQDAVPAHGVLPFTAQWAMPAAASTARVMISDAVDDMVAI